MRLRVPVAASSGGGVTKWIRGSHEREKVTERSAGEKIKNPQQLTARPEGKISGRRNRNGGQVEKKNTKNISIAVVMCSNAGRQRRGKNNNKTKIK